MPVGRAWVAVRLIIQADAVNQTRRKLYNVRFRFMLISTIQGSLLIEQCSAAKNKF